MTMDKDTINKLAWLFVVAHVFIVAGEIYFIYKLQQEAGGVSV